jgi:hypothetical protein
VHLHLHLDKHLQLHTHQHQQLHLYPTIHFTGYALAAAHAHTPVCCWPTGPAHALAPNNAPHMPCFPPLTTPASTPSCCIVIRIVRPGGVRTGGYPKTAPVSGPLGFQRPSDWDLLWSPARSALKAVPSLKAGQLVSAVPGLYSLTKKVTPVGLYSRTQSNWELVDIQHAASISALLSCLCPYIYACAAPLEWPPWFSPVVVRVGRVALLWLRN